MPQDPLAILPYYATAVVLSATKQSILTLLINAYAAIPNAVIPPNLCASELHLKADSGNAANQCLIGDINITSTNYGDQLTSSAADRTLVYGPFDRAVIPLSDIYALASGGSPRLLITVLVV